MSRSAIVLFAACWAIPTAPVSADPLAISPVPIARGANVVDRLGAPLGTVSSVTGNLVTITMDHSSVQIPLNAIQSIAGLFTVQLASTDLANLMALSAAYQKQTAITQVNVPAGTK